MRHRNVIWLRICVCGALAAAALVIAAGATSASGRVQNVSEKAATSYPTGAASISDESLKGKTIAYFNTGPIEFYERTDQGISAAVKMLGGTYKSYNSNFSAQTELANVQDAITRGVAGVVIEPLSDASLTADLRAVNRAKIPAVVLWGYFKINPSLYKQAVGFNEENFLGMGRESGALLKSSVPTGQVAAISGSQARSESTYFVAGFKAGFGSPSRVVDVLDGNYDRQTAFKDTQAIMSKYPNLKGLWVQNEDMAAGAIRALGKKAGTQVKVVSENGSETGINLVKQGLLIGTVGSSPVLEGVMATGQLALALNGHPRANKLCGTPDEVVTKATLGKLIPWKVVPAMVKAGLTLPCIKVELAK